MPPRSAGLLMFRRCGGERGVQSLEVLLAHPGGPYFAKKEHAIWSVPKGLLEKGEDEFCAARREFVEETSAPDLLPESDDAYLDLDTVSYKSGKTIRVWAFEADCDATALCSNTFDLEWPPKSGRILSVPEVDRFEWFPLQEAAERLLEAQRPLLDRLWDSLRAAEQ